MNISHYLDALQSSMQQSPFIDGKPATLIHLTNSNGMTITLMDVGATWLSCTLPVDSDRREVLLRSANMAAHLTQQAYIGATVGRFANRIAQGKFQLEQTDYQLAINNGVNALHGGIQGFDKRRWTVKAQHPQQVTFSLYSPHGEEGYPGNLQVEVSFSLDDDNAVSISYWAITDKATPVNLTNHAYFNLAGTTANISALEQSLQINAEHYLPVNDNLIPVGQMMPVANTSFDFRQPKPIKQDFACGQQQQITQGYDHSFVFAKTLTDAKQTVASLSSADNKVRMQIKTTKPAMQLYTGNFLAGNLGSNGPLANYDGIALETQYFPDAPNQHQLGQDYGLECGWLTAQQPYQHKTIYQFTF